MAKHSDMRAMLMKVAEKHGLGPVVFVPAEFSQTMNVLGLKMMAQIQKF